MLDAGRKPVTDLKRRIEAISAALRDESSLRKALWDELPPDVQDAIRGGRT